MIFALQASFQTLLWSLVVLFIILYAFAVFFTQGFAATLAAGAGQVGHEALEERFGSMGRSLYTLYMSMSNGLSWGLAAGALKGLHESYLATFLVFISITIFGVLNVLTSVFVESTMHGAQHYKELIVQENQRKKEMAFKHLRQVFQAIDANSSGSITIDEMEDFLRDPELNMYLEALDVCANDARVLFKLLDRDDNGEIDILEFCDGCMRLKGDAKSFDIHCMIYESQRIMYKNAEFMSFVEEAFHRLHHGLPPPRAMFSSANLGGEENAVVQRVQHGEAFASVAFGGHPPNVATMCRGIFGDGGLKSPMSIAEGSPDGSQVLGEGRGEQDAGFSI